MSQTGPGAKSAEGANRENYLCEYTAQQYTYAPRRCVGFDEYSLFTLIQNNIVFTKATLLNTR